MYTLSLPEKPYALELPETLKEAVDYLTKVVDDIHVANNYVLIGLVAECNLFALNLDARNSGSGKVSTVPIIAKYGTITGTIVDEHVGERAIISPSDIEFGVHTNCRKNGISINHVSQYIQSETNPTRYWTKDSKVFAVDFKVVPLSAIKGSYDCVVETPVEGVITNPIYDNNKAVN